MPEPLILLTGAAGRLGIPVHRTLHEAGKNVRATDRVHTIFPDLPLIKANILQPATCQRMVQDVQVLVHLAFRRDPFGPPNLYSQRTFDDHLRMNRQIFLAACEAGVKKIIFSSTIQVTAKQLPANTATQLPRYLPLDENSPPEPDNWYSLAKLCSEEMLATLRRQYGIDYTILRFPALFNSVPVPYPELHQDRLSEGLACLTYRDAANLVLKVIETGLPGGRIYLPASKQNVVGRPAQEIIAERYAGVPLQKPQSEIESLVDLSSLKRDLDWEPLDECQAEAKTFQPMIWRIYGRLFNLVPESVKPSVERLLSDLE